MTSRLVVNSVRHTGASADAITLDASGNVTFPANATCSGTATGFGGGKILQVLQTTKTDTASTGSTSFADILTVSITPSAATSKILLTGDLKIGYSSYTAAVMWKFVRDSTDLFIGDADGSRTRCTWGLEDGHNNSTVYQLDATSGTFLDSPNTTSAITYKVQWAAKQATGYLNRTGNDGNSAGYPRTASSLTVMEVSA